jgi:hypothetical protein
VPVSHHVLDRGHVHPGFQQVGGKGVAQGLITLPITCVSRG